MKIMFLFPLTTHHQVHIIVFNLNLIVSICINSIIQFKCLKVLMKTKFLLPIKTHYQVHIISNFNLKNAM